MDSALNFVMPPVEVSGPVNFEDGFIQKLRQATCDAVIDRKLIQLKTTINPPGRRPKAVRVLIIPEDMESNWSPAEASGSTSQVKHE